MRQSSLTGFEKFQSVETDQHTRLCATLSQVCESFIECDAPFNSFVFQEIYRHLICVL